MVGKHSGLSEEWFRQLEANLAKGAAAHGQEDHRWASGVQRLVRLIPVRRARERDDERWPAGQGGVVLGARLACGSWSLACLRGLGRILHNTAASQDLVQRSHAPDVRVRARPRSGYRLRRLPATNPATALC